MAHYQRLLQIQLALDFVLVLVMILWWRFCSRKGGKQGDGAFLDVEGGGNANGLCQFIVTLI